MLKLHAYRIASLAGSVISLASTAAPAALIVNAAQTIHEQVNINVIRVADSAGGNAAPLFGTAAQQTTVFNLIDQIWAQAGIDMNFRIRSGTYNNTFALTGTPGANAPRPTSDLNTITSAGASAGVADPDSTVLNLYVTRIVPGFSQTSDNTSNGLAFVGGNGITYWAGPALPSFAGGQEVLAEVLAHEIGHNLGLPHIVEAENLMQAGGSPNIGQRLNAAQISTAKSSAFTTVRGDTNADKKVDFSDLLKLAQSFGATTTLGRAAGDFDRSGTTDFADLLTLAQNFGFQLNGANLFGADAASTFDADWKLVQSLVPEPTTLGLAATTLSIAVARPRRKA